LLDTNSWDNDSALLEAWKNGQTGYPYIDAMTQPQRRMDSSFGPALVACFLTRDGGRVGKIRRIMEEPFD
jgi:hypothetical protein